MTFSLTWHERDPDTGKRMEIAFKLIRDKAHWSIQRDRFEEREPYQPAPQDWETVLDGMERNLKRGKVYPADIEIVRRLQAREQA